MRHVTTRTTIGTALVAAAVGLVPSVVMTSTATAAPAVILSTDFESGSYAPWVQSGGPSLSVVDTAEGKALLVANRANDYDGIETPAGLLEAGEQYTFTAKVRLAEGTAGTAGVRFVGVPGFTWIGNTTMTAADWTEVSGTWTVPADAGATGKVYFGTGDLAGPYSYLVDDILITGAEPPDPGVTVVSSLDFDDESIAPWTQSGSPTLSYVDADGGKALSILRAADYEGIQSPVGLLEAGVVYTFSMRARLPEGTAGSTDVRFVVKPAFNWVANTTITGTGWTEITGTYTVPDGVEPAETQVYIGSNNLAEPYTILVDDVLITRPASTGPGTEVDLTFDFEDATLQGWVPRDSGPGAPTVVVTDTEAHESTYAALVTDRNDQGSGIGYDLAGTFEVGQTYDITAWIKMADGEAADDIWLSIQTGPSSFSTVGQFGVASTEWREVTASYTYPGGDLAFLYFETSFTSGGAGSFLVDDITIRSQEPPIVQDITPIKDTVSFPVGVAIDQRETIGAAAELTLRHFDQVTPENHMKPEAWYDAARTFGIHPQATAIMDFASANDLAVYGHVLLWHSQTPAWFFQNDGGEPLTTSAADQQILRDRIRTHIFAVAEALSDAYGLFGSETNPLNAWDVVNEVVADSGEFADGLRRSEYYRILGEEYIDLAFQYADEAFNDTYADPGADRPVTLFINDYNTEQSGKQQRYYDLVDRLLDRGIPVDGVGHQFHVSLSTPISTLEAAIVKFQDLGLTQAVTELDVTVGTPVTEANLIEQGHYYRDAFRIFREYADDLHAVTLWGLTDARSWRSTQAPLAFDGGLQAKPAYYGIVDGELEPRVRTAFVFRGDVPIDGDALGAIEWASLPLHDVEGVAEFQLRWQPDHLTVFVQVDDATDDPTDEVLLTYGGQSVTVNRGDADTATKVVSSTGEGWAFVAQLPLAEGVAEGDEVAFNVEVTDGAATVSWGDAGATGTLTLVEELSYVEIPEAPAAPVIDGAVDEMWALANPVTTDTVIQASAGTDATAEVRTLWLDGMLYVLAQVTDDQIDLTNGSPWEQDSVEIFLDAGNYRNGPYRFDDTQIRINAENVVSFGTGDEAFQAARLTSATSVVEGGYIVEAAIGLLEEGGLGTFHGLDFQVNDATLADGATVGARTSVRTWADPTGLGYQSTARWGVGQLVAAAEPPVIDPAIAVGATTVQAGAALPVSVSGFLPGSTVEITLESGKGKHLKVEPLGQIVVGSDGGGAAELTVPTTTKQGKYLVVATQGEYRADVQVKVTPAQSRPHGNPTAA